MAVNSITISGVFLSVFCGLLLVFSILFNLTLLVTLLKLRRLIRLDKSNFFLTHLILADFLCLFFIIVPSGYSVYNDKQLSQEACHMQCWFTSFFFSLTFYSLMLLSIERFIKFKFPVFHINTFTKRHSGDEDKDSSGTRQALVTFAVIFALWAYNVFIAFIPMFANFRNAKYFTMETQCDYEYELFHWWLWLFFFLCLVIPVFVALVFYIATAVVIWRARRVIRARLYKLVNDSNYDLKTLTMRNARPPATDITLLAGNLVYYSHFYDNDEHLKRVVMGDAHIRKQLMVQYKYDTEQHKVTTFFLLLLANCILVFPVFVLHFYRTYTPSPAGSTASANNSTTTSTTLGSSTSSTTTTSTAASIYSSSVYDNSSLIDPSLYTAFVWISYVMLTINSFICLVQNKFYRHSLYQSIAFRGFHQRFDYRSITPHHLNKQDRELESKYAPNPSPEPYEDTNSKSNLKIYI